MATAPGKRLPPKPVMEDDRATWQVGVPDDDEQSRDENAADRVSALMESAEGVVRARVSLYKLDIDNPRKFSWCEDFSPEEFEAGGLAMIRTKWGGGYYNVRLLGTTDGKAGKPGFGLIRSVRITIETQAPTGAPVSAPQTGLATDLARVLEVMQQGQRDFQRELLTALSNRPDPMEQMRQTVAMMSMMREAMGIKEGPAPKSTIAEIVEAARTLREVSGEFGGEPKSDTAELLGMAKPILELVAASLAAKAQGPAPALAAPMVAAPEPVAAPVVNGAAVDSPMSPEQQEENMRLALVISIKKAIGELLALKAAGHAAESDEVFDYLNDHLPAEGVEALAEPQAMETLCLLDPRVKDNLAWFEAARKSFLDAPAEGEVSDSSGISQ